MGELAVPPGLSDFVATWGYLALGVGVALGLPVSEDVWLPVGGYLAWRGMLAYPWVIVAGLTGAVVADNLGYWAGRLGGRPLLDQLGHILLVTPARLRRAEDIFRRYGDAAVFFGRFLPWVRFSIGPLAGIARMPFPRFVAYNLSAALLWAPGTVTVGYVFAPHLDRVLALLGWVQTALLVVLLGVLLWVGAAGLRRGRDTTLSGDPSGAEAESIRDRQA